MLRRLAVSVFVMCLVVTTNIFAQQSSTTTGRYSSVRISTDTVGSPNGGSVVHFKYGMLTHSDDPNNLLDNGKGDCVGASVLSEDGTPVAVSGWCFLTDTDGDGYFQWWQVDETATPECPIMCGTWGTYNGFGKFENVSASGTFSAVTSFADGSGTGISEATVERP